MIPDDLVAYGLVFIIFLALSYAGLGRRIGGSQGRLLSVAAAALLTVGTMHYRDFGRTAGAIGVLILGSVLLMMLFSALHHAPSVFQQRAKEEIGTAGSMERSLKNLHGLVLRDGEDAVPQARQALRSLSAEDDALMAYIQDLQQMTERVKRLDVGRYGELRRESSNIRDWWARRK
ncbi:MAG: hypothetical protein Q8Q01_05515 [archaeon]|nr:hypothetical protein [archaeon]